MHSDVMRSTPVGLGDAGRGCRFRADDGYICRGKIVAFKGSQVEVRYKHPDKGEQLATVGRDDGRIEVYESLEWGPNTVRNAGKHVATGRTGRVYDIRRSPTDKRTFILYADGKEVCHGSTLDVLRYQAQQEDDDLG